jgi:hypothetical protein
MSAEGGGRRRQNGQAWEQNARSVAPVEWFWRSPAVQILALERPMEAVAAVYLAKGEQGLAANDAQQQRHKRLAAPADEKVKSPCVHF